MSAARDHDTTDKLDREYQEAEGGQRAVTAQPHAYELPPELDQAVDDAAHGEVVYLTRRGENVAAVVPLDVAAVGSAAVEALVDAEALMATRAALAEGGQPIPADELHAELGL